MRNWFIGAAALLAAAVAPGVAAAATGYIDLGYATTNADTGSTDTDADSWAADGVVAFDAHALGVQLDGRVGNLDADGADVDFWNAGAHVYKRQSNFLVGGYVGVTNFDTGGGDDVSEWTVALEGQYYLAKTTLNASLSRSEGDSDINLDATAIDLGVRHFINDNFAIEGNVGFANIDSGGDDADATSVGIGAEYQLASVPVSVFGGWQHSEIDDANLDFDTFGVGVRYNWGGTLLDRDRSGASLGRHTGGFAHLFGGII
jgi:hypothetical protein